MSSHPSVPSYHLTTAQLDVTQAAKTTEDQVQQAEFQAAKTLMEERITSLEARHHEVGPQWLEAVLKCDLANHLPLSRSRQSAMHY